MFATYKTGFPRTIQYEGGYSADRHDPGNWTGGKVGKGKLKGTKYGVSAAAFPTLDIKNLTLDDAKRIYKQRYWDKVEGDALPAGPDFATFDAAVHSGPSRSGKWLQQAIGGIPADGDVGPVTVNAARAVTDKAKLVKDQCRKRTSFLRGLSMWARYGKGFARRVADVEAFGVKLALAAAGAAPVTIEAHAADENVVANKVAKRAATGAKAAGTVSTGETVGTTQVDAAHDPTLLWLLAGGIVIGLIITAIFVWRAHVQRQRADAYRQLESEQRAAQAQKET